MSHPATTLLLLSLLLMSACDTAPSSRRSRDGTREPSWGSNVKAAQRALSEGRDGEARPLIKALRDDPRMVEVRAAYAPQLAAKLAGSQGVAIGERNLTLKITNPQLAKVGGGSAVEFILKEGKIAKEFVAFGFQQALVTDGQDHTWTYDLDKF